MCVGWKAELYRSALSKIYLAETQADCATLDCTPLLGREVRLCSRACEQVQQMAFPAMMQLHALTMCLLGRNNEVGALRSRKCWVLLRIYDVGPDVARRFEGFSPEVVLALGAS